MIHPTTPATAEHPSITWDDPWLEKLEEDEDKGTATYVIGGSDLFGNDYLGEAEYVNDELLRIKNIKLRP